MPIILKNDSKKESHALDGELHCGIDNKGRIISTVITLCGIECDPREVVVGYPGKYTCEICQEAINTIPPELYKE